MVGGKLKYGLFLLILISWQLSLAQGHLYSEVSVNKSKVFVGEPVEVSIAVFTSTWFTKGVDPGNVKVNGAFTVYFRGVSESRQINGKTYAGVRMIFNVFPYDDDDIVIPSIEFKVETPDEGGYKGIKRNIKTKPKVIIVNPVPAGYNKSEWMVSSGVEVKDKWTGNKSNVKVGDVLERHITRTAAGTVSGLITPIVWDTINGVSVYPSRSLVEDIKTKTSISAKRTDGIKYFFEKEGEVKIPKVEIMWWNAYQQKLYKRTLKEITLKVLPNPDLGMLESIRDSLQVRSDEGYGENSEGEAFTIFGLSIKQFVLALVLGILIMYLIVKSSIKLERTYRKRKERYKRSELYFFRQFAKSVKSGNPVTVLNKLYLWIDQLKLQEPTVKYFAQNFGNDVVLTESAMIEENVIINSNKISLSLKSWSAARKMYLERAYKKAESINDNWINP